MAFSRQRQQTQPSSPPLAGDAPLGLVVESGRGLTFYPPGKSLDDIHRRCRGRRPGLCQIRGRRCIRIRLADSRFAHAAPADAHSAQVKIKLITEWSLL